MTQHIIQHIFNGFITALVAICLWELYQYLITKRTPLQKFKPGARVWVVNLNESNSKSGHFAIVKSKINNRILLNDNKTYFGINKVDRLLLAEEIFFTSKDAINYANKLKSESNE